MLALSSRLFRPDRSERSGPTSAAAPRAAARPALMALMAAGWTLIAGCGHPASLEECEVIFQRTVEIELRGQNITDPKIIAERREAVRAARGQDLINRCVGRRITDRAVACVRQASTADEVDRCLR